MQYLGLGHPAGHRNSELPGPGTTASPAGDRRRESRRHILAVGVLAQTAFLTGSSAAKTGAVVTMSAAAMAAILAATLAFGDTFGRFGLSEFGLCRFCE